jgi:antitoxin (DNA-binding transcriptional repressor) of toxin-antitoxin stability system
MVEITIEEIAKDPLTYLHRTHIGESFVVLQAGQPIAQINPILPSKTPTPDTVDEHSEEEAPLMQLFLDFAVSEALKNQTDNRDVARCFADTARVAFARLTMPDVLKLGDELEGILIHAAPYDARYPSRD